MKCILITGGAGFIGSHFISYFFKTYSDIQLINIDCLSYASDLSHLKEVAHHPNYIFVKGNITDTATVRALFTTYDIEGVIHFAAESHVDNSIVAPKAFIKTNVEGTLTLLETAKNHWMTPQNKVKERYKDARFLHISTDEVYGTLKKEGLFTEQSPYAPNSPYSASKAASDFLVRSYFHTYGLNVITTHCTNNYGPKQHDEKFIPTIIRNALQQTPIPIYGSGNNIRDWIYVEDHCAAIDLVFHYGNTGETYLVGAGNEMKNIEIAHLICMFLDQLKPRSKGSYKELITFVKDRPGHDFRYGIDPSKIKTKLNWEVRETFDTGIKKTIAWYIEKYTC